MQTFPLFQQPSQQELMAMSLEDLERRYREAQEQGQQATQYEPVHHPLQGLAKVAQAGLAGFEGAQARSLQEQRRQALSDELLRIVGPEDATRLGLGENVPSEVLEVLGPAVIERRLKDAHADPLVMSPGQVAFDRATGERRFEVPKQPVATISGTNIEADSEIGRKYEAYVNQGFDHDQALGVASGRYDLRVTENGTPVMIDRLTNSEVPIGRLGPAEIERRQQQGPTPGQQSYGQPKVQQQAPAPSQAQGQSDPLGLDPQTQQSLYQMAEHGTGLWNIMGDLVGRVGPQFVPGEQAFFPDQRQAVTAIQMANRGLVRAIQQSPRYAEGERASIERELALNPSIGMSPEAWRQSASTVDRTLRQWWTEDMQDARNGNLAAEDRQRAVASARAIERYLQVLGAPQDGSGGQAGAGQGNPVQIGTPEEAQRLSPGTLYRTPDGQLFRR